MLLGKCKTSIELQSMNTLMATEFTLAEIRLAVGWENCIIEIGLFECKTLGIEDSLAGRQA